MKNNKQQLNIFDYMLFDLEEERQVFSPATDSNEPYRNAVGELLPWEEPEYLKNNL